MQDDSSGSRWQVQIAEWKSKINMPDCVKPWSEEMVGAGISKMPRVKALLDVIAFEKLGVAQLELSFQEKKQALRNVFCDLSQNPRFRSYTNCEGVTGCLCTSTVLYSFHRDGAVLPLELLRFQGHRRDLVIPEEMSSNQVRDLAGEGMALPCLGTVLWAVYLTKGFP